MLNKSINIQKHIIHDLKADKQSIYIHPISTFTLPIQKHIIHGADYGPGLGTKLYSFLVGLQTQPI